MRLCSIDLGTNTILLTIVEINRDGSINTLYEEAKITRIGFRINETHRINSEAAKLTLQALRKYKKITEEFEVDEIIACATSALRDAINGQNFINSVSRTIGIPIKIISGEEEANLLYLVALNEFRDKNKNLLLIDIGGGSSELVFGNSKQLIFSKSISIGSVRLTERYIKHDPMISAELKEVKLAIKEVLPELKELEEPFITIGTGGAFTTLQSVKFKLNRYDPEIIHKSALKYNEAKSLFSLFNSLKLSERKVLKGLESKRADIIPIGTLIVLSIMEKYNISQICVSDRGLRWGIIYNYLA